MKAWADIQSLYQMLPHAGAMRLISQVLAWDQRGIRCRICNHANPEHPMRQGGMLPAVCALEYAAQAAALHAVLSVGREQAEPTDNLMQRAVVVTVRQMSLYCDDLAVGEPALLLVAERVFEQHGSAVFDFTLRVDGSSSAPPASVAGAYILAEGQFGVMVGG